MLSIRIIAFLAVYICIIGLNPSLAQFDKHKISAGVAVLNDATALPFSGKVGVIHTPVHPGLVVSLNRNWTSGPRFQWSQNVKLGYINHYLLQQVIQLYTEANANYAITPSWKVYAGLGAGYLHAFRDNQDKFELQDDGTYKKKRNFGRPQIMFGLTLGTSLGLGSIYDRDVALFINYHSWFQFPFVNQYVPLLPHASLQLGVNFDLYSNTKKESGEEYF